ncbi:MAG: lantibiotic dehydratase family protein [Pseudonocardia sp.]|nr:lantibiotic dehydratase family protein [Pseudonocardia sp.]
MAGLPVSAVENLRFAKTWAAVNDVVLADRWIGDEGSRLSDELYTVIGGSDRAPLKSRMVALRRAVFGGRKLPDRIWDDQVRKALPAVLVRDIAAWDARRLARDELSADLPGLMAEESTTVNGHLRQALADPAFQYGLVTGSPPLFAELTKWLDGPLDAVLPRQTVLGLATYVLRVVAKTSPYSSFTVSGLLPFSPGAEPIRPTGTFSWTTVAELDMWLIQRIAVATAQHPRLWTRQRVRLNPSLHADRDGYTFLTSGLGNTAAGSVSALVRIRGSVATQECITVVGADPGTTVDDLGRHLRAVDPRLGADEVVEFVTRLVDRGLLLVDPPYGEQDLDHLGAVATWVTDAGIRELTDLATDVRSLHAELLDYPRLADPSARPACSRRIVTQTIAVGEAAGAAAGTVVDLRPRKSMFHENAVFLAPVAELGADAWAPVLADLDALRPALGLFDPYRPIREAFADVFVATFGPGRSVPWLDFYRLASRLADAGDDAEIGGVTGATVRALAGGPFSMHREQWRRLPYAREQANRTDAFSETVRNRVRGPDDVLRISPTEFASLTQPTRHPVVDALTCYVQLVDDERPTRVALNVVTSGYGRGHSRVARFMRQVGIEPPEGAVATADDGTLLVEFSGSMDTNLNLRDPGTTHELATPFSAPVRGASGQIPMNDLQVAHDPATNSVVLRSHRHDCRIRPVHSGLVAEILLPRPLRHLVETFGAPSTLMHASLPLLLLARERGPMVGGVGILPRLEVGNVVVSRRCWALAAREMPWQDKGESDVTYWIRLARWLARHDIPEQFFLRVKPATETTWRLDQKSRKPTYVDVAIWYSVASIQRLVESADDLVLLTEVLPDLGSAPRYGRDARVTEFTVELPAVGR